jgi:hypothetical protein
MADDSSGAGGWGISCTSYKWEEKASCDTMQEDSSSPHRERLHGRFVLGRNVGQCQIPNHGQTLFLGVAAESLQLGADDAFLGQKRDELVPEEMRI